MSNKRIKELRNLTKDELQTRLRETERSMFESRMKLKTGQLENVSSLWLQRKDLARIKMLLAEKSNVEKTGEKAAR